MTNNNAVSTVSAASNTEVEDQCGLCVGDCSELTHLVREMRDEEADSSERDIARFSGASCVDRMIAYTTSTNPDAATVYTDDCKGYDFVRSESSAYVG